MVYEFAKHTSVINNYLAEIRDQNIQKDRLRFRKNMERISEIIGYEISKSLEYQQKIIITPLGISKINLIEEKIVIASILRAGLSMHNGLLNRFDKAENAFVSAYREKTTDDSVKIKVEYMACPSLEDKTLIIADPMLATGKSMELVIETLLKSGTPKKIIIASVIASQQAIEYLQKKLSKDIAIWVGAIDSKLDNKSYIVPGLGDAGDLAYGEKL